MCICMHFCVYVCVFVCNNTKYRFIVDERGDVRGRGQGRNDINIV